MKNNKVPSETNGVAENAVSSVTGEIANCAKLNIRSRPDPKAPIIETLPMGTKVIINLTVQNNKFYEVLGPNGKKGYGMKLYINPLSE